MYPAEMCAIGRSDCVDEITLFKEQGRGDAVKRQLGCQQRVTDRHRRRRPERNDQACLNWMTSMAIRTPHQEQYNSAFHWISLHSLASVGSVFGMAVQR